MWMSMNKKIDVSDSINTGVYVNTELIVRLIINNTRPDIDY